MHSNSRDAPPTDRGVALLGRRIALLADELKAGMDLALPNLEPVVDALGTSSSKGVVVVGIGSSEGPARLLARALEREGIEARYAPVSRFVRSDTPEARVGIVVSQGLSPNARLALAARSRFAATLLVTSLDPGRDEELAALARDGVAVLRAPPSGEGTLFLRVVGPAVAMLVGLRVVGEIVRRVKGIEPAWAPDFARVVDRVRELTREDAGMWDAARALATVRDRPVIVVGTDTDGLADELVVARLVEGLGATPPALVDACAFVHGPWQAIHDRSAVIVCVGRDDATNRALVRRVESCLVEGRHTLVTFTSDLAGPLAAVAIDAALVVAVARALPSVSWDLVAWPGKGDDGPLYDLGAHALDGMIARTRT